MREKIFYWKLIWPFSHHTQEEVHLASSESFSARRVGCHSQSNAVDINCTMHIAHSHIGEECFFRLNLSYVIAMRYSIVFMQSICYVFYVFVIYELWMNVCPCDDKLRSSNQLKLSARARDSCIWQPTSYSRKWNHSYRERRIPYAIRQTERMKIIKIVEMNM